MSLNARHAHTFKHEPTGKPSIWHELFAVLVFVIGFPIVVVMEMYKPTKTDIVLFAGFIFCCVTVMFLAWSISGG